MPVIEEKVTRFKCSHCGSELLGNGKHWCNGYFREAKQVVEMVPPPAMDLEPLGKIIHSMTYMASAAASYQFMEENKESYHDIPCGANHRMALANGIEVLGDMALGILEGLGEGK